MSAVGPDGLLNPIPGEPRNLASLKLLTQVSARVIYRPRGAVGGAGSAGVGANGDQQPEGCKF